MSRDYTMKEEPSAVPWGSVSQWYLQRGWNRCPGVSIGPRFLHSSVLMEAQMVAQTMLDLYHSEEWVTKWGRLRLWEMLNAEVRICLNRTQLSLPGRESKVDVQMISPHFATKYLSDRVWENTSLLALSLWKFIVCAQAAKTIFWPSNSLLIFCALHQT